MATLSDEGGKTCFKLKGGKGRKSFISHISRRRLRLGKMPREGRILENMQLKTCHWRITSHNFSRRCKLFWSEEYFGMTYLETSESASEILSYCQFLPTFSQVPRWRHASCAQTQGYRNVPNKRPSPQNQQIILPTLSSTAYRMKHFFLRNP